MFYETGRHFTSLQALSGPNYALLHSKIFCYGSVDSGQLGIKLDVQYTSYPQLIGDSLTGVAHKFSFDESKALSAILLISKQIPNVRFHRLMKILYFADLRHLSKYGRPVIGDRYVAMDHGPVPSNVYNMLKGENQYSEWRDKFFSVSLLKHVTPKLEPDMDEFSDSDIECLEFSIRENKDKSWIVMKSDSHDNAWMHTWNTIGKNKTIPVEDLIEQSGASPETQNYILERLEREACKFDSNV